MEWNLPRDRLAIRAYIRTQLRSRGLLEFADDDLEAARRAELVYMHCGSLWHDNALERTQLRLDACLATTTDMPMQSVDNTLVDNDEFWSSTGASVSSTGEALLYRLQGPLSQLSYVRIAVYRAHYQHGDPLYPPRKVSFLTGPTPNQLYPASPVYPVRLTDEEQVFALSPTAPVSQYLMVRLHGRMQRQWEDLQFYIAIRHVSAYGTVLQPNYCQQIARLTPAGGLAWPATHGVRVGSTARLKQAAMPLAAAAATCVPPLSFRSGRVHLHSQPPGSRDVVNGATAYGDTSYVLMGLAPRSRGNSGDEDLPPADVFEVGPVALALERQEESPATAPAGPTSRWRWPSVLSSSRHGPQGDPGAAQTAGAPPGRAAPASAALQPQPFSIAWSRSASAMPSAAAGGAPAGTLAPAALGRPGRVMDPTGPTEAEVRLAVERNSLARAVSHLAPVAWPETLLVQGESWRDTRGGWKAASKKYHHHRHYRQDVDMDLEAEQQRGPAARQGQRPGWGRSSLVGAAAGGPAEPPPRQGPGARLLEQLVSVARAAAARRGVLSAGGLAAAASAASAAATAAPAAQASAAVPERACALQPPQQQQLRDEGQGAAGVWTAASWKASAGEPPGDRSAPAATRAGERPPSELAADGGDAAMEEASAASQPTASVAAGLTGTAVDGGAMQVDSGSPAESQTARGGVVDDMVMERQGQGAGEGAAARVDEAVTAEDALFGRRRALSYLSYLVSRNNALSGNVRVVQRLHLLLREVAAAEQRCTQQRRQDRAVQAEGRGAARATTTQPPLHAQAPPAHYGNTVGARGAGVTGSRPAMGARCYGLTPTGQASAPVMAAGGARGSAGARQERQRQRQRRRWQPQRVAERAVAQPTFRPGGPLFIALREWAGVGGGDGGVGAGSSGSNNGSGSGGAGQAGPTTWLVSHYDHEHL